jgi:hypothetical protein
MLWVGGLEPHCHWQIQFDAVARTPLAMSRRETSGNCGCLHAAAVYRNRGPVCPRWNPETQSEIAGFRCLHIKLHQAVKRIPACLRQRDLNSVFGPSQCGRDIQIHPYALRIAEVSVDAIVGCDLRQRARTASPVLRVPVDFMPLEIVIGIIKSSSVGHERLCSQHRVVHDPLHTVSVAGVAGHAQQVARQLEMRVRATGSFKTAMAFGQAGVHVWTVRSAQRLIGPPAPSGKALLREHRKSILRGAQMFLTA